MSKGELRFSHGGTVDDIKFAKSSLPSKYASFIESISKLNHKQTVAVPFHGNPEKARLRLRQAVNRYIPPSVALVKRYEVRKAQQPGILIVVCYVRSREVKS